MSFPIHVTAYSGYQANERPRDFTVDEGLFEVAEVEDRWYEPDAMYFRVRTTEGKRYILRYDESEDEWRLQNGFDGDELLARLSIRLVSDFHGHHLVAVAVEQFPARGTPHQR
jgi:hypothetical protein